MPRSISDFIGADAEQFASSGAFDAVLEVDSRFYIDPTLLKRTKAPELAGSYERLRKRYGDILTLLAASRCIGDAAWRAAANLFHFKELKGLCIGYAHSGTSGSGMGAAFRDQVLRTAKEMVDAGVTDPAIFELIGILEEGIGSDRISDMVGRIITEDILAYSQRVFAEFGAKVSDVTFAGKVYRVPMNPHNKWPVLLLPRDILRPLPVARSWDEIDQVCEHNRELRRRLNLIIGQSWRRKGEPPTSLKKKAIRGTFTSNPEAARGIIDTYLEAPAPEYDFGADPLGEIRWHRDAKQFVRDHPLPLSLPSPPKLGDVLQVVLKICQKLKDLVENNGLHALLYDGSGKPKHESAAQKLFYAIADSYCEANNLDLNAEMNSGRGYIDFKVSYGYSARVLVEVKLTTNPRLRHGYEVQLHEYEKAEHTTSSVFLAIDVLGGSLTQLKQVYATQAKRLSSKEPSPELIIVKAKPTASASKFRPAS